MAKTFQTSFGPWALVIITCRIYVQVVEDVTHHHQTSSNLKIFPTLYDMEHKMYHILFFFDRMSNAIMEQNHKIADVSDILRHMQLLDL